jgi:Zn-dependent protease with chaperone function
MEARRLTLEDVVYARERVLFAVMVLVSLGVYGGLGFLAFSNASTGGVILFYGAILALVAFLTHALAVGRIRGNGVLVSARQFPLLQQLVTAHGQRLGLSSLPTVYVLESGGILNAFATKLLGRKFVIVNADVLALAVRRGRAALSFIVGHELGHHWRGHLKWRWLIAPARLVPYLGPAYSRACEYTCDRIGALCEPEGAIDGLLVLAAGSWLHEYVNAQEFASQAESDRGFWIRRAEWVSSHPRLPRRVAALLALGVPRPGTQPLPTSEPAA